MNAQCEATHDATDIAWRYNRVREFSEQLHEVETSVVESVGMIFVKHQAHKLFGLTLLHRHGTLDPGTAMVHTLTARREDRCIVQRLGTRMFYPCSFFVDSPGKLTPLEFSADPVPAPEASFLSEIRSYFTTHGLTQILGITHILPSETWWVEHQLLNHMGTVAIEANPHESNGITTVWQFFDDGAGLRIKDLRKCVATESGAHRVT